MRLETLESREVPANLTITVDTLTDVVDANDGRTSLREAAAQIAGATIANDYVITFADNIKGGTITFDPALGHISFFKIVNDPIKITVDGTHLVTTLQRDPSAQQNHRLFTSSEGIELTVRNLTFQHGKAALGGAISSNGDLIVEHCNFYENRATTSIGGAVNFSGTVLTISGSNFVGNHAEGSGGALCIGTSATTVSISVTAFLYNTAEAGGAIEFAGNSTQTPVVATFNHVTLNHNEARTAGGAVYVHFNTSGVNLTTHNTTISTNKVVNANPQYVTKGGGIYFGKGTLNAVSLTFANNDAKSGDGLYLVVPGSALVGTPTYTNDGSAQGTP